MHFPKLRLYAQALMSALLLTALAQSRTWAGSYVMTSQTGGTISYGTHIGSTGTRPYAASNGSYGAGQTQLPGDGLDPWITCSGEITTVYTWKPAYTNDLPPQNVVVTQTCSASAIGQSMIPWPTGMPPQAGVPENPNASASNGLSNGSTTTSNPTSSSDTMSQSCSSTYYEVKSGGQTVTITCSPSASASGDEFAQASVGYQISIAPVVINLTNTVVDNSGNLDILIGQNTTSSLACSPLTANTWQWNVTGNTFQSWGVYDGPGGNGFPIAGPAVSGFGPSSNSTASWFWNDGGGEPNAVTQETVNCAASGTFPDGTTGSVNATLNVNVYVPNWSSSILGGTMLVNPTAPDLYAGPALDTVEAGGMNWYAAVQPPNSSFESGQLEIVQEVTPGRAEVQYNVVNGNSANFNWSTNGQLGLDTQYPYYGIIGEEISTDDSPSMGLADPGENLVIWSATMADSFTDYLMYEPPNSGQFVTVGTFPWNPQGVAVIPTPSFDWANYEGDPGTVNPSGSAQFTPGTTWPQWSQNSGNNSGHFVQVN